MTKFLRLNRAFYPAFCSLFMVLLPLGLMAQQAPVSVAFTPPDGWQEGDEIELIIDYGTEDIPVEEVTDVQFVIEMPEGTSLSSESDLVVTADDSWFAFDNGWTGTAELSDGGYGLIVSLSRTNGHPATGYGEVARVKGLIVEVAEIIWKGEYHGNASVAFALTASRNHLVYDLYSKQLVASDLPEGAVIHLMDATGRVILAGTAEEEMDLSALPAQYYIAVVKQGAAYLDHLAFSVLP